MEINPGELLEEMLRKGEQTVFPTLRKCAGRFVDIFNDSNIQHRIREKLGSLEEFKPAITRCENANTLFYKLKYLKQLLQDMEDKITESGTELFLSRLFDTGFIGLITDENLDFLTSDDFDQTQRVEKFIHYLEHGAQKKEDTRRAFEEYIETWKRNNIRWGSDAINKAEREMRANFVNERALSEKFISQLINEIATKFEPLRDKLVSARETYGRGLTVVSQTSKGASWLFKLAFGEVAGAVLSDAVSCPNATRASTPGWYDDTSRFITKYLSNRKTDDELLEFIRKEKLEPDFHHFRDHIDPWLIELSHKINEFKENAFGKSYILSKEMILREIDRMRALLYAIILNKPEKIEEHRRQLDEMIQEAAKLQTTKKDESILPSISFGQLPLPGGNRERGLIIKFVLSSSLGQQAMNEIMSKITKLFDNVESSSKKVENGATVFEIKLRTDDNISTKVARCISSLADLQVRSVLVGEFGLGGFRHAMNPAYNRIYSIDAVDKAEGFKSTHFSGSLDRGGEPYFCPNGWRRYSIDVGLTGPQFEAKYRNWHVAYHGTEGHIAMAILLNGIRASGQGCFIVAGQGAVYLSPSIEYSSHPRYAGVWQIKDKYVQMVLQVRVDRNLVFEKRQGTLSGAQPNDPPMDSNFRNNKELEWVIKWPPGTSISSADGVLVYGIMLRVTDQHPKTLPQNAWWAK